MGFLFVLDICEEDRGTMEESLVRKMHERLGCHGCNFADPDAIDIDACCTRTDRIEVDGEGRCKMREGATEPGETTLH